MAEHLLAPFEVEPQPRQSLPPELRRIARVLCDTYESLDLRIETTLAAAEHDFINALHEVQGHDDDLRRLVALLTADLRSTANGQQLQSVLLRLSFNDEDSLERELLSSLNAFEDLESEV